MQANSKTNPKVPAVSTPETQSAGTTLWSELCDWDRQTLWSARRLRCALAVPTTSATPAGSDTKRR